MTRIRVAEKHGSHLLVCRDSRFAVVERRNGKIYDLDRERQEFPDTDDGIEAAVGQAWTDESRARRLFDEITRRGDELSQRIW